MAYKDEIYVAHLLTSEEKRRRDFERYNVDPSRGDRIDYRHLTRPHFQVLGLDIRFDIKTRDWMLNAMKRMRFLRSLFGSWHREEKDFRDWYEGLIDGFDAGAGDEERYDAWVQVLDLPDQVRGYREVVWPKMARAKEAAACLLDGGGKPKPIDVYREAEPLAQRA